MPSGASLPMPSALSLMPLFAGQYLMVKPGDVPDVGDIWGARLSAITLDRVQVLFDNGNITKGRLTVWGIAHA